ncbi:MAG: hypothetical protein Q4C42_03110 [Clostridia bacterium]|nr:hypothetical protein [Clostridia bacterium]
MKVLFLGNSHTYYNDMPHIFENICKEREKNVEVHMQAHPGVTYEWHLSENTELRYAMMYGHYDYIIMQQASHIPCPSKEETHRDAKTIIAMAKDNGVTPIQTMPWAEKDYPEHQATMYDVFCSLHDETGIRLNPVGNVFEDVLSNHPEINMYWLDNRHASAYGSYAAAMCAYATIFGESVQGLSPMSYDTFRVADENWSKIAEARKACNEDPENFSLREKLTELCKEYIKPVMTEAEARVELESDKAEILQKLVDKYALK